jgi:hypothetical protein
MRLTESQDTLMTYRQARVGKMDETSPRATPQVEEDQP